MDLSPISSSNIFLPLKEDFSHYRFINFLSKSEIFQYSNSFIAMWRCEILRIDCGIEFMNAENQKLLGDLCIVYENTNKMRKSIDKLREKLCFIL